MTRRVGELQDVSIEELIDRYSVLLLDAFGVLVDGSGALPGAIELINQLNRSRKPYYILTNDASMLPTNRARRYHGFGLAIGPDRIISSGTLLPGHFEANHLRGARCVVVGPEDSSRYVENAGGRVVPVTEAFEVLVIGNQGDPFLETVDAVLSALFRKLDGQGEVHLVLPNPDLTYPQGDQTWGIASASMALVLEAALEQRYPHRTDLRFVRLGKPHNAMFAEALRRSGTMDMVMIGDQLETDIRGASAFGLDSVLMNPSVTAPAMATVPAHLRPTYRMLSLTHSRQSGRP